MAIITRRWNCGGLALLGGKASAKPASGSFKYGGNLDTRGTAVAPANKKGFTTQLVPNGFLGQQGLPFLPKQQF